MAEEKPTPTTETHGPNDQDSKGYFRDKRILPEGVVPRQAQGYVIAGLTVMILMAVLFSKNHARTASSAAPAAPTTASNDANARRIEELEQNLDAEQRQSQQQAQTQKATGNADAESASGPQAVGAVSTSQSPPPAMEPQRDPVVDAERELAFKARFASNLISTDARASHASDSDVGLRSDLSADTVSAQSVKSLQQPPASQVAARNTRSQEINVNSAHGQPYALFEGTTIDTALVNRLDGEFAGPVKVMVTNPVYSQDRQHVLIPEGTFILGSVQKVGGLGQKRLAVTFHRMLMPDNYSVDLDQFQGLDQIGDTGLKDKVNNHYLQIFGASIALGIIAGAAESTTYGSYSDSGSDMYRQGMASSLSQSSANVLDKFINIPPTNTIREGHRVKVYLTQDMLLPAYENHDMSGVM